jgi:hypothetical protein
MASRRVPLGREVGIGRRSYLFLTAEAVEVDDVEGLDVYRTRVLLEDVSFLTLHKTAPWGLAVATLILLVLFSTVFLVLNPAVSGPLLLGCAAVCGLLGLRLYLGVTYVSVVGRRGRARMAWSWRPQKAREVFALLVERVGERQALGAERPGTAGGLKVAPPLGDAGAAPPPAE